MVTAPAFADKLAVLVSMEMADAHKDADRQAVVLERLLHSAAFTIGLMAKGSAETANNLLTGAESYLYDTAAGFAPIGKFMATPGRRRGR